MILVQIHLNLVEEGTRWWAEGGDFVGGADILRDLVSNIRAWANTEGKEVELKVVGPPPSMVVGPDATRPAHHIPQATTVTVGGASARQRYQTLSI